MARVRIAGTRPRVIRPPARQAIAPARQHPREQQVGRDEPVVRAHAGHRGERERGDRDPGIDGVHPPKAGLPGDDGRCGERGGDDEHGVDAGRDTGHEDVDEHPERERGEHDAAGGRALDRRGRHRGLRRGWFGPARGASGRTAGRRRAGARPVLRGTDMAGSSGDRPGGPLRPDRRRVCGVVGASPPAGHAGAARRGGARRHRRRPAAARRRLRDRDDGGRGGPSLAGRPARRGRRVGRHARDRGT